MSKATALATERLETTSQQTAKFLERVTGSSERVGRQSSITLVGAAGGALGALSAVGLAHIAGISLALLGGPLSALGILTGVLLCRGTRRIKLERRIAENRMAADEILDRIKALPKNAPPEIRDGLWRAYGSLTQGYQTQTAVLLAPRENESRGLLLPGMSSTEPSEKAVTLELPPPKDSS
jgi:hypothetical protein